MSELEAEFEKLPGGKPQQQRFLRSQQDLKAKMEEKVAQPDAEGDGNSSLSLVFSNVNSVVQWLIKKIKISWILQSFRRFVGHRQLSGKNCFGPVKICPVQDQMSGWNTNKWDHY